MNYGSRVGWYHQIFLPLICAEMEHGEMSLLGTLDWLTLCVVGAGACAAQLVKNTHAQDKALAKRGLAINLGFGDYIEACFPFLSRDKLLNITAYVASSISGAVAAHVGARSTAFLAAPLAIGFSNAPRHVSIAGGVAFTLPFSAGIICNLFLRQARATD